MFFSGSLIGIFKKSANSLPKSCLGLKEVVLPTSNCRAVEREVSPPAPLEFSSQRIKLCAVVSSFAKSGPTSRIMN